MPAIRLSADGATVILNGHIFQDFIEGDTIDISAPNPHSSQINGVRPDSMTVTSRSDRHVRDVTLRIQRFSDDDIFMNSILNQEVPEIVAGSMKESYFHEDGTEGVESWLLEQGTMTDQPSRVKNTQDGNAVMEYTIRFRNARRNV